MKFQNVVIFGTFKKKATKKVLFPKMFTFCVQAQTACKQKVNVQVVRVKKEDFYASFLKDMES